eukprot:3459497-Amphidinium_carterae.1
MAPFLVVHNFRVVSYLSWRAEALERTDDLLGQVIDMVIRPNAIVNPDLSIEVDSEQNAVLDVLDRLDRLLASDASSQAL